MPSTRFETYLHSCSSWHKKKRRCLVSPANSHLFTMRDYTCNEYCDYLWISDLLSLKKGPNNEYRAVVRRSGEEKTVKISNVAIYGCVVEIKQIGDKGILYSSELRLTF